jgi:non-specific serine/threonine protein kinase/serine/threonine-protein kinase
MSDDEHTQPPGPSEQETESHASAAGTSEHICPYRLLQRIGEGGMGEVWEAEQEHPIRRRVALKLIKLGMDSKAVIARFEAERQALAMMDHPNVAKVFDAGTTEQGRPYFVMEYVHGVPLTEHCDLHRLENRERLQLYRQICEGVQHAHQKSIIHRDIKPSNVLVSIQDGKAMPKIIDFGVAKAISQKLTERTLFTAMGQLVGTPAYMSPEQAEMMGQDVDTRTDVYSLGVMLYELLTGALPFDPKELREAGFDEIRRRIREEEPSRPSTKIITLGEAATGSAKNRRTDVGSLRKQLTGDLDWITMKALDKDRSRRYASPQELAADVERHLKDEPVLAGPPSAVYRARKFVRRHRFGVAAAAASVVVLIGFAATMAVQARRIASERDRAEQAKADLESVVEFQSGMLSGMDTEGIGERLMGDLKRRVGEASRGRGLSEAETEAVVRSFDDAVRGVNATDAALRLIDEEILGRAVETLEEKFAERPLIDARLRKTIGVTYTNLGLYSGAEPELRRTVETQARVLGDDHPETLRSMGELADLYSVQGRYDEAEPLYLETLEVQRRVLGDDHPLTLRSVNDLARLYFFQGRHDEAEPLYLEILETKKSVLGGDHLDTLVSIHDLASLYQSQRRYDQAESLYLEILEIQKRIFGDNDPETLNSMSVLAGLYELQSRYDEAESLYLETIEAQNRVLRDDHPDTLRSMNNLAILYGNQGRYDEAEPLYLEILETQKLALGNDHPHTLTSKYNLASLYKDQGRYDEAETLLLEILEGQRRVFGNDHPNTLSSMSDLAGLYRTQGRYDEAEHLVVETLEILRRVFGGDHPGTLGFMENLAILYADQGRFQDAEILYRETLDTRKRVLGNDHPETLTSMYNLACLEAVRGNTAVAIDWLRRAVDAGFAGADWMAEDSDLLTLHGTDFDALVSRARLNAAAQQ